MEDLGVAVGQSPRLVSRAQAARYCSLSASTFSSWVRSGKLPPPLPGTSRWDLKAIDFALDAMSGLPPRKESDLESNQTLALDNWRAAHARRFERRS
jgi:hypothetical protein